MLKTFHLKSFICQKTELSSKISFFTKPYMFCFLVIFLHPNQIKSTIQCSSNAQGPHLLLDRLQLKKSFCLLRPRALLQPKKVRYLLQCTLKRWRFFYQKEARPLLALSAYWPWASATAVLITASTLHYFYVTSRHLPPPEDLSSQKQISLPESFAIELPDSSGLSYLMSEDSIDIRSELVNEVIQENDVSVFLASESASNFLHDNNRKDFFEQTRLDEPSKEGIAQVTIEIKPQQHPDAFYEHFNHENEADKAEETALLHLCDSHLFHHNIDPTHQCYPSDANQLPSHLTEHMILSDIEQDLPACEHFNEKEFPVSFQPDNFIEILFQQYSDEKLINEKNSISESLCSTASTSPKSCFREPNEDHDANIDAFDINESPLASLRQSPYARSIKKLLKKKQLIDRSDTKRSFENTQSFLKRRARSDNFKVEKPNFSDLVSQRFDLLKTINKEKFYLSQPKVMQYYLEFSSMDPWLNRFQKLLGSTLQADARTTKDRHWKIVAPAQINGQQEMICFIKSKDFPKGIVNGIAILSKKIDGAALDRACSRIEIDWQHPSFIPQIFQASDTFVIRLEVPKTWQGALVSLDHQAKSLEFYAAQEMPLLLLRLFQCRSKMLSKN